MSTERNPRLRSRKLRICHNLQYSETSLIGRKSPLLSSLVYRQKRLIRQYGHLQEWSEIMEKWIDDLENQLWEADERVKKVTNERDNLFSITMAEKRSTILRSTLHDDLLLFAINIDDMSAIRFRIYLPALSPDPLAEGVLNATSSKMVLEKIEVEDRFAFSLGSRLVKQIIEFAKSSGAEKVLGRFQSRLIKRNNLLAIFRMNEFNISVEGKAIQVSRSIKK